MAAKQDIAAAAEAHMVSYIDVLLSPIYTTTTSRAEKMASYYFPKVVAFVDGNIIQVSESAQFTTMIVGTLDTLETDKGMLLEEKEHRVEVVGENSAIVWLTWKGKELVWTNTYFFRRMESGEMGFEGGNMDGEMWVVRELAKEQ